MLYLLWTALNGVAFCYFFAASIASIKAIRERVGLLPLLVVLVGLLSFRGAPQRNSTPAPRSASTVLSGPVERLFPKVENYYIAHIQLAISYNPAADSSQVLSASSHLAGLSLGNTWDPNSTGGTIQGNQLHYYADGIMHWRVLGITLYREYKHLTGTVALR